MSGFPFLVLTAVVIICVYPKYVFAIIGIILVMLFIKGLVNGEPIPIIITLIVISPFVIAQCKYMYNKRRGTL